MLELRRKEKYKMITFMLGESTHQANSKEWVNCLILISLISHLIQSSALPAGPLPGDSGKPHGAAIYMLKIILFIEVTFTVLPCLPPTVETYFCIK